MYVCQVFSGRGWVHAALFSSPALTQACIDGSMEMVSFLLAQGAHVDQVDSEGWTPLHVAASGEHIEITE